jgi:hypothetical protein
MVSFHVFICASFLAVCIISNMLLTSKGQLYLFKTWQWVSLAGRLWTKRHGLAQRWHLNWASKGYKVFEYSTLYFEG